MTEPTSELVKRLDEGTVQHPRRWSGDTHTDLGGSADEEATDALMKEAARRIEALEAEVGKWQQLAKSGGAKCTPEHTWAEWLAEVKADADRRVAEEREACAKIANDYDGFGVEPREMAQLGDASRTCADIALLIRSRSNGAEPTKDNGESSFCSFCGGTGTFDDPARGDDKVIECSWCNGTGDSPRVANGLAASLPRSQRSANDVSESVGKSDWAQKREQLLGWTGSAVLSGDEPFTAETRGDLYSFLCSLIGYLHAGEDLESSQPSHVPDGWQQERERLIEVLKNGVDTIEESWDGLADLDDIIEWTKRARRVLSSSPPAPSPDTSPAPSENA
jgi:hypothetical protein